MWVTAIALMLLGTTTRHLSGQICMGEGKTINSSLTELWVLSYMRSIIVVVPIQPQSALCMDAQIMPFLWAWKTGFLFRGTFCDKLGGNVLRSVHLLSL